MNLSRQMLALLFSNHLKPIRQPLILLFAFRDPEQQPILFGRGAAEAFARQNENGTGQQNAAGGHGQAHLPAGFA